MVLKKEKTNRGFSIRQFQDRNGVHCSLQKSSLADEDAIWFGCNDADPRVLIPGKGWAAVELPLHAVSNTRMHLTQKMVKSILPYLQKFVETGEL